MNIEDQVVSLELAKKLKEIGMEQESHWVWFDWGKHTEKHMAKLEARNNLTEWQLEKGELIYPAFTVAELMEGLPRMIRTDKYHHYELCVYKSSVSIGYVVEYEHHACDELKILQEFENGKLADALAEMAMWLRGLWG